MESEGRKRAKKLRFERIQEDWGDIEEEEEQEVREQEQMVVVASNQPPPPPVIRRGRNKKLSSSHPSTPVLITDFFAQRPGKRKRMDDSLNRDDELFNCQCHCRTNEKDLRNSWSAASPCLRQRFVFRRRRIQTIHDKERYSTHTDCTLSPLLQWTG